jgi:hypothetical protein
MKNRALGVAPLGRSNVKLMTMSLILAGSVLASPGSIAQPSEDEKVNQCLEDKKDQRVSKAVLIRYCKCMDDEMDDNETESISKWEKSHPKARTECARKAGWK